MPRYVAPYILKPFLPSLSNINLSFSSLLKFLLHKIFLASLDRLSHFFLYSHSIFVNISNCGTYHCTLMAASLPLF